MDPDPHLHLVLTNVKGRLACRGDDARCQRHPHRPARLVDFGGQVGALVQGCAFLGGGTDDLFQQHRDAHAATARREQRVLHRHVIVGHD